jgi:hypothetical protein
MTSFLPSFCFQSNRLARYIEPTVSFCSSVVPQRAARPISGLTYKVGQQLGEAIYPFEGESFVDGQILAQLYR